MSEQPIRFDDGAAYERMMGIWSRLAGEIFLDWLAPRPGLKWVDIGCGNGAFTELVIARNAPAGITGIDPSDGQLAYARTRGGTKTAQFSKGDHGPAVYRQQLRCRHHGAGDLLRCAAWQKRCRDGAGRISYGAWANAIKGRVPGKDFPNARPPRRTTCMRGSGTHFAVLACDVSANKTVEPPLSGARAFSVLMESELGSSLLF